MEMMDRWITSAFAERFGVSYNHVRRVGTLALCLCRTDEARRYLLQAGKRGVAPTGYSGDYRLTLYRKRRMFHLQPKENTK